MPGFPSATMSKELAAGVYEIYYTTDTEVQPFGLDSVDAQPPQLVELPVGGTPARFTIAKVGTNKYTVKVNGSYLAPDDIWVRPRSTAFTWTILNHPVTGLIGSDSYYAVWLPDKSAGWLYLVLGGRRRSVRRTPIGELQIYLEPDFAAGWWFKKVA